MLLLKPSEIPDGLLLTPISSKWGDDFALVARPVRDLAAAGVNGAYYSAAFLLRAVAADTWDMDPDEINISSLRAVPGPASGFVGD
jgi:hypothetical protein